MRYNSSSVRPKRGEELSSLLFALLVLPLLLEEEEDEEEECYARHGSATRAGRL
jgi:hypothetical protein